MEDNMRVTIEGVVNSDVMQRGDQETVQWTPRLANLRKHGLIRVIDWQPDEVVETPIVEGADEEFVAEAHHQFIADEPDEPQEELIEPPRGGKGATLPVWRDFVSRVGLPVHDDDLRDDLIDRYDDFRGR